MNQTGGTQAGELSSQPLAEPTMTGREIAMFWFWPILFTCLWIPFFFEIPRVVVVAMEQGRMNWLMEHHLLLFSTLTILSFLAPTVLLLARMIARKRKTGSLLPEGEELSKIRRRKKLWDKVLPLMLSYWFAILFTCSAFSGHTLNIVVCLFLVIMWLIAIFMTVGMMLPVRPRWLYLVLAGLFFLSAAYSTFHAFAIRHATAHWVLFSVLMWALAAVSIKEIIRPYKAERRA